MKISVSFLKSKFSLQETIEKINQSTADFIHVDLMDGTFVASKTENVFEILECLKKATKPLDIHLMMEKDALQNTLQEVYKLNPYRLAIHSELSNTLELIDEIKTRVILCGLAVNPDTTIEETKNYLKDIDFVLIMSVYPGRGGQAFLDSTISKLQELKKIKEEQNLSFEIAIDGGINNETVSKVKPYCDTLISGSFICMNDDYNKQIAELKKVP